MTEADSAPSLTASPLLPPAVQDEIDSLALLVNETQGGLIAFALYRDAANRFLAATALGAKVMLPVVEFPLSPRDPNPVHLLQELLPGARYCVFITRLEEALPRVAGILNLQREIFAELPHAVIFWVTGHGLRQLALLAPDFWAWRSGVFDLRQESVAIASADFQPLLDNAPEFRSRADLEKRILLYQDLLQDYQQQMPPDHRFLGDLHHKLAAALYSLGEYQAALAHASQSVLLREKVYGPDHPEVAIALNNLGLALWNLGDLPAARAAFERALAVDEKIFGPDYPCVGRDVYNLGGVLGDLGDFSAAKTAYERALAILEKVYGPDHHISAAIIYNLGRVLWETGDIPAARAAFKRALAITEKFSDDPNFAIVIKNLAGVYQGDLHAARVLFERVLADEEKMFGPDHLTVAIRLNNLGGVLQDMGDLPAAKAAYERTLAISEKVYGPDHPEVAAALTNLGGVLLDLGYLTAAKAAYERALAIFEKFLSPDHSKTELVRRQLASLNR